jgi:hypothetical protein
MTTVAIVLFLLPWAVTLVLVRRHHHLDSAAVTIVVSMSLGLPAVWLAWASYWVAQREADRAAGPSLAEIADGLDSVTSLRQYPRPGRARVGQGWRSNSRSPSGR